MFDLKAGSWSRSPSASGRWKTWSAMPRDEGLSARSEVNVDRSFILSFCVEAVGKTKGDFPFSTSRCSKRAFRSCPCQGSETSAHKGFQRAPFSGNFPALTSRRSSDELPFCYQLIPPRVTSQSWEGLQGQCGDGSGLAPQRFLETGRGKGVRRRRVREACSCSKTISSPLLIHCISELNTQRTVTHNLVLQLDCEAIRLVLLGLRSSKSDFGIRHACETISIST
jgi:hypothetical protein